MNRILKQGYLVQNNFKKTIPFTYVNGFIVLKASIKGKEYNFILDTGASNFISEELAKDLNLEILGASNVSDINSTSNKANYASINSVKIGTLDFKETVFGLFDFSSLPEFNCLDIDGIIGSNLMRMAIWDFNFDKQLIIVVDNQESLNIPSTAATTKMYIGTAGLPSITLKINGKKILNHLVDLGNTGHNFLRIDHFKKQLKNELINTYVEGSEKAWGAFGRADKSQFYKSIIDSMTIGNCTVNHIFTDVNISSGNNLGLQFLKNFRVILNWKNKKISLVKKHNPNTDTFESFGFTTLFENNNLFVNAIIEKSSAAKYLKGGEKIVRINNVDYTNFGTDDYCDFLNNHPFWNENKVTIVVLRNGREVSFEIDKLKIL